MKSLYLLLSKYIRREDDYPRSGRGVYSPGPRDEAEEARDTLFTFILETPGKAAFLALQEIGRLHSDDASRSWMDFHARNKAAIDADVDAWTLPQISEFEKSCIATPSNHRELWEHAIDKIETLKRTLEDGDFSTASVLIPVTEETEIRNFINNWCREHAYCRYSIEPEVELADAKRPDLRFQGVGFDAPVPAELKRADKWSGERLFERLKTQLCGDYLRDDRSTRGIFLLVAQGGKQSWDLPGGARAEDFESLVRALQTHWSAISDNYSGVEDIRVIGIDLTRRGVDGKAAKKMKERAAQKRPARRVNRGKRPN